MMLFMPPKAEVSAADKATMARVGAALDRQLGERRKEAGLNDPGKNMKLGLRLFDEFLRREGPGPESPPPHPVKIWRVLEQKREGRDS